MTRLKEGSKEAKRKEEDDADGYFGMVYQGNVNLTIYGTKLLDHANAARAQLVGHEQLTESTENSYADAVEVPGPP